MKHFKFDTIYTLFALFAIAGTMGFFVEFAARIVEAIIY